jgi:1-phosphatidylinositol-4-phosphate 5-kinase
VEHFWKGMSAPSTQISPIPPQAYGDRFLNFITGITMTREEAVRRKTEETQRGGESGISPVTDTRQSHEKAHQFPEGSAVSPILAPEVEKTMQKAQKQTDKATSTEKGRIGSEEEKPDRTLKTTEEPRTAALLPVVQEAGEGDHGSKQGSTSVSRTETNEEESRFATDVAATRSVPGLRKVSPSTVGTASEMGDETTMSSPQEAEYEYEADSDSDGYRDSVPDHILDKEFQRQRPPRLGSDLIQPHSPFMEDSVFESLDVRMRDSSVQR